MHVMVGTDGSEGGDRAVDMAAKFATAAEAKLLVMTVVNSDIEQSQDMDKLAHGACCGCPPSRASAS